MHTDDTLHNLEASVDALKVMVQSQLAYIRHIEHERDLLVSGYKDAMEKCDRLEALLNAANDPSASVRTTPYAPDPSA